MASVNQGYLGHLLHPADYDRIRENPENFSQSRDDIEVRSTIFKTHVGKALDQGNYSRIARGVGFFVSLYHFMTDDEISQIGLAKELLEDELFDLTTGLQATSTNIERHKIRLRRPGVREELRQIYQANVSGGQAALANDLDHLNRLLQDIGLLTAIEEEET